MRHIFIINPKAGKSDDTEKLTAQIKKVFENRDEPYAIEVPTSRENTTKIAANYARSNEKVVLYACGGDGTLNDVLNGCMNQENVILSHVPIGSGNDFIKFFGKNAKKDFLDLEQLINGNIVDVDVLSINDHYSINIANIGLDAMVAFNANKFKRLPFVTGKSAYQISLAYSFFTSTKHFMKIKVDGEEQKEDCYSFVVCANAKYYGGSYCAAPFADLQDGLMDVILIPKVSRPKILQLMNIYQKGQHLDGTHDDIVHYFKAKKVEIQSDHEIQVCLEGEGYTMQNPLIQIADQKIPLLVPKKYTHKNILVEPKEEEK